MKRIREAAGIKVVENKIKIRTLSFLRKGEENNRMRLMIIIKALVQRVTQ